MRRLVAVLALLAALDLARPYAGPGLRPLQWLAGALTLLLLWRFQRERGVRWREALPSVALAALLLPVYLDHSRNVESDGNHYYAWLRSALFDLDLDLANDYRLLEFEHHGPNVLPVGAPMLWSPLVVPVHLLRQASRLFGLEAPTGVEPLYQGAACLATFGYVAAGLFLLLGTLSRFVSRAAAFWTTLLCWIGSPLRFYLSVMPGFAHGAEFFAAVLVLRTYLALRETPSAATAARAGAACGLVFLLRSQDGLLLGLPGVLLTQGLLRGPDRAAKLRLIAVLASVFVLVALPQLLVWQATFGVPILVPHKALHGEGFMHTDQPRLLGTLVSPRGGLFTSYPVTFVATLGLLALAWRDGRYLAALLPVLLAGWYVNATVFDWYQVRRFTGIVPLLAPALALVLAPLCRAGTLAMAVLALATLRYDQAVDGLRSNPGDPAPVRVVLAESADAAARDSYRWLEPHAPVVAVRLLDAYTGEPLLEDVVSRIDLGRDSALLRLPERARHFSGIEAEDGLACRWANDREARLFLPLAWSGPVKVVLHARPLETIEPQVLEPLWNDASAGRSEMAATWADYRFDATARAGTNVLVLRFDRGPIYRRMRGRGPHQVRPAAIAWIDLHRPGPQGRP